MTSRKRSADKSDFSENIIQTKLETKTTQLQQTGSYENVLVKLRSNTAASVMLYKFNKKRIKILSEAMEIPENSKGILYWMSRDVRVQDNWAMLFAQKLAFKNQISLHVCFCLEMENTSFHRCTKFIVKGLEEVQKECIALNIKFHLFFAKPDVDIPEFIRSNDIGALVCDCNPLRFHLDQISALKLKIPSNIPFCQVDAHNIIPCYFTSDKLEYSAKLIRPKIHSKLEQFLTEFPPVIFHPYKSKIQCQVIDWEQVLSKYDDIADIESYASLENVVWAVPGYKAGISMLQTFCEEKLESYADKRNDPVSDSTSSLSPWIRNGHISAQRCVLAVKAKGMNANVEAFIEEACVRRELADNFCYYNKNYDRIEGASDWAIKTLQEHRNDNREYLYSKKQFEESRTHDDLWNSAQMQLVKEGRMHNYLRMYWAKKILEWSNNPEEALDIAIYLNDRYSLDGCDPNGYVGCLWSIAGVHDQPWVERDIFGKIRYMNYAGCKKKFDVNAYVAKYGGTKHMNGNDEDKENAQPDENSLYPHVKRSKRSKNKK